MNPVLSNAVKRIVVPLFLLLLAGSLFWYRQRMLFVDPGWIVFNVINNHNFSIAEYRYGAFITQMVPLIGSLFKLPLSVILLAYSASFYLFYTVVVLLLLYRYKQYGLALLMALYFTLFVSDVYFWPNNEVHQGIAWMFLFLGHVLKPGRKQQGIAFHTCSLLFAFLALFSHFLVLIPFSFLWLFLWSEKSQWTLSRRIAIMYTILLALIFFIKYRLGVNGWYDGGKLNGVKHISTDIITGAFSNGQAKSILPLIAVNYWLAPLLLIAGLVAAIKYKKYLVAAACAGYSIGYFVLLCITFPDAFGREWLFYMESEWMAMAIIIAIPFVYFLLPRIPPRLATGLLLFIFTARIVYIAVAFPYFNDRYNSLVLITERLREKGIHKALFVKNEALEKRFIMSWGLPAESMLYSGLENHEPQVSFKFVADSLTRMPYTDTFLSAFSLMPYKELNAVYFHTDTTQAYQQVSFDTLFPEYKTAR